MTQSEKQLSTSEERRKTVIAAATAIFAARGYYGTSTIDIAKQAGISHAYVFKLFVNKEAIFVAVVRHCYDRMLDHFQQVAVGVTGSPNEKLKTIGISYAELLKDRALLLIQLHSYGACSEPAIRDVVRTGMQQIIDFLVQSTGASDEELRQFIAEGLLSNIIVALGIEQLDETWANTLTHGWVF